jgi:NAD(P)-dependent dehydrogenase (short-subunit alcohol dehydrogenase family)
VDGLAGMKSEVLIFGSSGFLGSSLKLAFEKKNVDVLTFDRDTGTYSFDLESKKVDAVVFAQGVNQSSGIQGAGALLQSSFDANVGFIVERLEELQAHDCLAPHASVVIISSIWQKFSRAQKLPYIVSKSALEGLVKSLAFELGESRRVNAVLPGVVESPMALQALGAEALSLIQAETPSQSLVTATEISNLVFFLALGESSGVNGQSIVIDKGWTSNIRMPS